MNPQIRHAQRACEAAKARRAVVVWFDEHGQHAVASYGETKAECAAVKPLCNAIADAMDKNALPLPPLACGAVPMPCKAPLSDYRDVLCRLPVGHEGGHKR